MTMECLLICGEEIALEGLDGCPGTKLWKNLEETSPPFPMKIDDDVKTYLWKGIVEVLDLKFYALEKPLPHIFANCEEENRKKFNWNIKEAHTNNVTVNLSFNSFHMINDGDIRGSCPEYETRKDITSEIRSTSGQCLMSLQQAVERWGDHLAIVASQEMRTRVLIEDDVDPDIILSPMQYCLLEHVGQARTDGRLQRFMAPHFNIDAKTLFFILKKLSLVMGFVRKQKSVINCLPTSNVVSNVIRLKRFCAPARHPFEVLGVEMCQFLATQPQQMISFIQLKKHYDQVTGSSRRTTIKRVRQYLEKLGHVKVVIIRDPSLRPDDGKKEWLGRERYYLQLISPLVLKNTEEDEEEDNDDNDMDESPDNPNLVMELPIAKQMYEFIESRGPDGVTNKDIDDEIKLFKYDRRAVLKFLESKGNIKHVMTYAGRQSILRFVAMPHVEANYHTKKILEEQKKLDAIKEEVSSQTTVDDTSTAASTPLDSPCPSPAPSLQSSTPLPKVGHVTYRNLKRNNFIVDLLKEKKVIEGSFSIRKALHEAEEKEGLETKMDRRFLKKCLTSLIEKGMVKKLKTIIDVKEASHNVEFYLHSSINPQDPEVNAAIEACRFRLSGDQTKTQAKKNQVKPPKASTDEDEESDQEKVFWTHDLRFSYGYLAKFPRMQLMHEFFWQALFGVTQENLDHKTKYQLEHAGTVESGSTGADVVHHSGPQSESGSILSKLKTQSSTSQIESVASSSKSKESSHLRTHNGSAASSANSVENISSITHVGSVTSSSKLKESYSSKSGLASSAEIENTKSHHKSTTLKGHLQSKSKSNAAEPVTIDADAHLNTELSKQASTEEQEPMDLDSDLTIQRNKAMSTGELNTETHNYGWIGHLARLPQYDQPQGWVRLIDLLKIMPLSVFCNTVGIIRKVDGLDEYYFDPQKTHTAFKDLPARMRKRLKFKGRYKSAFTEIVCNMMCAGLVMPEKPLASERLQSMIHFSRGAIALDTSKEFTVGEYDIKGRQDFPYHQFVFNEFSDLQSYWEELKYICLRTSYGKHQLFKTSRNFKFSDCITELITEDNLLPPPGDGRGAAGFDSFLNAHLSRNWSFRTGDFMKFRVFSSEKRKLQTEGSAKPVSKKQKKEGEVRKLQPKKKRPMKVDAKAVPDAKKQKTEEIQTDKVKDKDEPTVLNISSHIVAVDETDKAALAKRSGMRVSFSPEHDRIILLSRVALGVMDYQYHRSPNPYIKMRDLVHELCPNSFDKTAPNCRARLITLMKNPKNVLTVKVCVAEYRLQSEFAGVSDQMLPFNETFLSTVKRIIELSRTQASSLEDTSQLLSSIDEMYENYSLQKLSITGKPLFGYEQPTVLGKPICTINDIRRAVAKDIIQMTCHNRNRQPFDSSYTNKMFDDYDLDEITQAGKDMKKANVITKKKYYIHKSRNMPWKLSSEYFKLLDPSPKESITRPTFDAAAVFIDNCYGLSGNCTKIIRLKESTICGGKVAAFLSLMVTGKVTAEYHIPDEILGQTVEPIKKPTQKDKKQNQAKPKPKDKQPNTGQEKTQKSESKNSEHHSQKVKGNTENVAEKANTIKDSQEKQIRREDDSGDPLLKSVDGSSLSCNDNTISLPSEDKGSTVCSSGNTSHINTRKPPSDSGRDLSCEITKETPRDSNNDLLRKETDQPSDSTNNVSSKNTKYQQRETSVKVLGKTAQDGQSKGLKDKVLKPEKRTKRKTLKKKSKDADLLKLANPFIGNESVTHCKFNTNFQLPNIDSSLLTPQHITLSHDNVDTKSDIPINRPIRTGKMLTSGIVQPKLLMRQGYNTLDSVKINHCDVIVRPKVAHDANTFIKGNDISMVTKQSVARENESSTTEVAKYGQSDALKSRSEVKCHGDVIDKVSVSNPMPCDDPVLQSDATISSDVIPKIDVMSHGDVSRAVIVDSEYESKRLESYPFCIDLEELIKKAPTLEGYLEGCKTDRCFNAGDEQLTRIIYNTANDGEELGTTVDGIMQVVDKNPSLLQKAAWSLEKHLTTICNNKLLVKVGWLEDHYVTPSFAKVWSVSVKKTVDIPAENHGDTSANDNSSQPSSLTPGTDTVAPVSSTASVDTATNLIDTEDKVPVSAVHSATGMPLTDKACSLNVKTPKELHDQVQTDGIIQESEHDEEASKNSVIAVQSTDVVMTDVTQSTPLVTPCVLPVMEGSTSSEGQTTETQTPATSKEDCSRAVSSKSPVEESLRIITRPWLEVNGQINKDMMKYLFHSVTSAVVGNPGITQINLYKKFMRVARPVTLSHVLEYLIDVGSITKHEMFVKKPSLFSSDVSKKVVYFMPVVDCIVTLGKVTQKMA